MNIRINLDQERLYKIMDISQDKLLVEFEEFSDSLKEGTRGILKRNHLLCDLLFYKECELYRKGRSFSKNHCAEEWEVWLNGPWQRAVKLLSDWGPAPNQLKLLVKKLLIAVGATSDSTAPRDWRWEGGGRLLRLIKENIELYDIIGWSTFADCCETESRFSLGLNSLLSETNNNEVGTSSTAGTASNGKQPQCVEFVAGEFKTRRDGALPTNPARMSPLELAYLDRVPAYFLYRVATRNIDQRIYETPLPSNKRTRLKVIIVFQDDEKFHKGVGTDKLLTRYKGLIFKFISLALDATQGNAIVLSLQLQCNSCLYPDTEILYNFSFKDLESLRSKKTEERILFLHQNIPGIFSEWPREPDTYNYTPDEKYDECVKLCIPGLDNYEISEDSRTKYYSISEHKLDSFKLYDLVAKEQVFAGNWEAMSDTIAKVIFSNNPDLDNAGNESSEMELF